MPALERQRRSSLLTAAVLLVAFVASSAPAAEMGRTEAMMHSGPGELLAPGVGPEQPSTSRFAMSVCKDLSTS